MPAAPLTKARAGSQIPIKRSLRPLAANAKAFRGGIAACRNGFYLPATGAADEVVVGVFYGRDVDNTGGADGAKSAEIEFDRERLVRLFDNDGGAPVLAASREGLCTQIDDHAVAAYDPAKGSAFIVYDVTSEGVWCELAAPTGAAAPPRLQSGTITLVAGTRTVTGVVLTANSRILLTMKDPGAGAIPAFAALNAPAGSRTSSQFVVNAIDNAKAVINTAVCTVDYLIVG